MSIVVLGAGFAGFWAAMAAKRIARHANVVIVSRSPVLEMRPRLYESEPQSLGVDLLPVLGKVGVEFVQGDAIGLDVETRKVRLAHAQIDYARLIVATGSALRRPSIPGVDKAFSIDTQADAIRFDRRLSEIASKRPTVAVIGAGFTGVELALELRDRIARHGGDGAAARIVLIERGAEVGMELGPGPRPAIVSALETGGIEVRLNTPVTAIESDRIVLDDTTLQVDAVVLTTGMEAAGFARHVPGEHDRLGRLVVDRTLRAPEARAVFVTGDAAVADTGDGYASLQSCQHALQLGRFAGENAARDLLGLQLVDYAQPRYVTCLDLGRAGAVFTEGWDRVVKMTGAQAKAVKRRINEQIIYPPRDLDREAILEMSKPATAPRAAS